MPAPQLPSVLQAWRRRAFGGAEKMLDMEWLRVMWLEVEDLEGPALLVVVVDVASLLGRFDDDAVAIVGLVVAFGLVELDVVFLS